MHRTISKSFSLIIFLLIYTLGWLLQNKFIFNSDVSWLLHASNSMLHGGTYSKNFMETNPPLILYLYTPALFIEKIFSFSIFLSLRLYIFLLITLSLGLSNFLITKILNNNSLKNLFIISLAFSYVILPLSEFGQREHIAIILSFPYILLLANRLQRGALTDKKITILMGFLAGLGFAIKPYFLIPWILLEVYYCLQKHSLFAWMRSETFTVALTLAIYLCVILIFQKDYITTIIPLITPFYYQLYTQSLATLLTDNQSILMYLVILFYACTYQINHYKNLSNPLIIASTGYWIAYVVQRLSWYYHALPFLFINVVLTFFLFQLTMLNRNLNKLKIMIYTLVVLISINIALTVSKNFYYNSLYKNLYQQLINKTQQFSGKSVYFFTTSSEFSFPLVQYTNMNYASRFWSFVWLPLLANSQNQFYKIFYYQHYAELNFYINAITEDFLKNKPEIIFVDKRVPSEIVYKGAIVMPYINLFSLNPSFKSIWNHYHYLSTIDLPPLCKFDIYQHDSKDVQCKQHTH